VEAPYQASDDATRSASIECTLQDRLASQARGSFAVATRVRNVVYPAVEDWLVEVEGRLESSASIASSIGGTPESFVVTLGRPTRVVALANARLGGRMGSSATDTTQPPSLRCPNVTVGAVEAEVLTCSETNVTFKTPSFSSICGSQRSCGYQPVRIVNTDGLTPGSLGGGIVCPGACPMSGLGFFYTSQCEGFATPAECSAGLVDQSRCAFGVPPGRCRRCSANAICPGGLRMWPMEGYWTAAQDAGSVVRCPSPPEVRCRGWDVENDRPLCGMGYSGKLCSECARGYYAKLDLCVKCPDNETESALRVAMLIVVAVLLFIVIYASLHFSPIASMGSSADEKRLFKELLYWQAKDFVIWSVLLLQLFSTVSKSASANAKEATELFSWLNIVSFDLQAVGPECFNNPTRVFLRELVIFTTVLFAILMAWLLGRGNILGGFAWSKNIRGNMFTFLTITYTPAALLGFNIAYCIESNGQGEESILVAYANPNFECAGEAHGPALVMGCLVLLLHSIAFPVWSFIKIRAVYSSEEGRRQMKMSAKQYRKFFGDDFLPEYYWMLQCYMAMCFTLCWTRVYLAAYEESLQIARLLIDLAAIATYIFLTLYLRPYVRHMAWKLPVITMILTTLAFTCFLEFFTYLHANRQAVSTNFVKNWSIIVLTLSLFNFILLSVSFWFVVHREKTNAYFVHHFLLQKSGRLTTHRRALSSKNFYSRNNGGSRKSAKGLPHLSVQAREMDDGKSEEFQSPSHSPKHVESWKSKLITDSISVMGNPISSSGNANFGRNSPSFSRHRTKKNCHKGKKHFSNSSGASLGASSLTFAHFKE